MSDGKNRSERERKHISLYSVRRIAKTVPKIFWIKWFDIDETTHGSIFAYPSLEAFEEHTEKRESHRKESSDNLGITLIHKHDGLVRAEASN